LSIQGGCKENGSQQKTQVQNGGWDAQLLPCIQLIPGPESGVHAFKQKQFKYLLQLGSRFELAQSKRTLHWYITSLPYSRSHCK
jgi:hypothetical protein